MRRGNHTIFYEIAHINAISLIMNTSLRDERNPDHEKIASHLRGYPKNFFRNQKYKNIKEI
jgi:hypothetical protein